MEGSGGTGSGKDPPGCLQDQTQRRVESSQQTTRTPLIYLLMVSCHLELSLQSSFQLSLWWFLLTIGLVLVFRLRWSLPPTLGCVPKQPNSRKIWAQRAWVHYRPHTVNRLGLDQKDLCPP